jgi:hypothetical protein
MGVQSIGYEVFFQDLQTNSHGILGTAWLLFVLHEAMLDPVDRAYLPL